MDLIMKNKTILVLGGGLGGVVAATELRKKLDDNHRIVVFDKQPQPGYGKGGFVVIKAILND